MLYELADGISYQGSGLRRGLGSTVKNMSFVLAKPYWAKKSIALKKNDMFYTVLPSPLLNPEP